MTSYSEIYNTLSTQLATVANLPVMAVTNAPFKPTLGSPYARDTFMPVEAANGPIGINGWLVPQGLYQIDVFYPVNVSTSVVNALAMADAIVAAFPRGTINSVNDNLISIIKSYQMKAIQHPEYYQVPVMVKFAVYGG